MASIKSNISPQVKDRLRRAILTEISADDKPVKPPPGFSAPAAAQPVPLKPPVQKPALKTLRRIEFKSELMADKQPTKAEEAKPQKESIKPPADKAAEIKPDKTAVKKASKKSIKKNMPAKDKIKKTTVRPKAKKKAAAKAPKKSPKKTASAAVKTAGSASSSIPAETAVKRSSSIRSSIVLPDSVKAALGSPAKKIFSPKPFTPIYEAEDIDAVPSTKAAAPKFGLYRSGAKAKSAPAKEESLEKLFQTSPKVQKAQKAALAHIGKEPKAGKKFSWLKLIAGLAVIAIAVAAFDIIGIYQFGFNDSASYQVAKTLNLPAGVINGQTVGVAAYLDGQKSLSAALLKQREGIVDYSGKSDINDKVFYYLAVQEMVENKLAEYGKSVSDQDVETQIGLLLQQTGGQAGAEKIVRNLYDMSLPDFKAEVLRPMMERQALLAAIMDDPTVALNAQAKEKAAEILKMALASSTDFETLAGQYSEDESSVNTGGDLGWVGKGQLDASWEPLIFAAAANTVVSTTVKSAYGYHIVKVEQKVVDKATGSTNAKLRHILIKVDIDKYVKDLLAAAKVNKYIK